MELISTILVPPPKVNLDTRGIEIIDILWEVVKAIIETRIKTVVILHGILHGFCPSRGTEAPINELNMAQEIASIDQDPLLLVFLDLWKEYDTLERGQLL